MLMETVRARNLEHCDWSRFWSQILGLSLRARAALLSSLQTNSGSVVALCSYNKALIIQP